MRHVFGIHAVDSLLRRHPKAVRRLLLQAGRSDKRVAALLALAENQGVAVERSPRERLDSLVAGRHQGAVAEVDDGEQAETVADVRWDEARLLRAVEDRQGAVLLLVLDGVTDPHNLGACLRCADAAGVDAVVVPRDNAADLTPVASKVACGAAETVPFVRVTNLSRTLQALRARGVWLYGADGGAPRSLYETDLTGPLALVMGAEGKGLRRLTREQCDHLVRLPMRGAVDSLNVSVAAGICLFEAVRQRTGVRD